MKTTITKTLLLAVLLIGVTLSMTGCIKPYDKPEIVTIEPSQTAFLIPLVGSTSDQAAFQSEELLEKAKVPTKQVQIKHRWLQEGRQNWVGKWIGAERLIVVERKPETRVWTDDNSTGTSNKNEGIVAESKESIAFTAKMNCSAQIDEADAVKFLYRYNNKPLSEVLDTEIKSKIESIFVEECGKLSLEDILLSKSVIMEKVRKDITSFFKEKGITITVIGLKGDFTYNNKEIQESIDNKFKSAQNLITQKNDNERNVSKATADAEAIRIQAANMESNLRLKELQNQTEAIAKWNGVLPTYMSNGSGAGGLMFNIPVK